MTNITFYGASVTAQNKSHDGDIITGFVPVTERELKFKLKGHSLKTLQLGYGSNHFNDAGLIFYDLVKQSQPDIVVMDWHTTGSYEFNPSYYHYVMTDMLDRGIIVLNLFLPFKRHVNKTTEEANHFKQTRWYSKKYNNCHILNFYKHDDIESILRDCLRDDVHTNEHGAVKYGEIIADCIMDIMNNKKYDDHGPCIEPKSNIKEDNIIVDKYNYKGKLKPGSKIKIKLSNESHGELKAYAVINKGPHTATLKVNSSYNIETVDAWCRYRRKSLCPLTRPLTSKGHSEILIEVTNNTTLNEYNDIEKTLDIEDGIYVIGQKIYDLQIERNENMKILIFANCHGVSYKNFLQKNLPNHDIENIISYENLDAFDKLKDKFSQADILVIQPVNQYEEFKLENLKKILKPTCIIIRVPFVRFDGFWPTDDERQLSRFAKAAVMFFPKLNNIPEVVNYLTEEDTSEESIRKHFHQSVEKLRQLESTGDVNFVDFFLSNYKKKPLFRDSYHPTQPMYNHLAHQIYLAICKVLNLNVDLKSLELQTGKINQEFGHYKPIKNVFAKALGIQYDLSSYFITNRYNYLVSIINHENKNGDYISDLNQLLKILK